MLHIGPTNRQKGCHIKNYLPDMNVEVGHEVVFISNTYDYMVKKH